MPTPPNRRDVLRTGTAAACLDPAVAARSPPRPFAPAADTPCGPLETVRVGFVGVGVKGAARLGDRLHADGVEVVAVSLDDV